MDRRGRRGEKDPTKFETIKQKPFKAIKLKYKYKKELISVINNSDND